jgi:hypothetical protein
MLAKAAQAQRAILVADGFCMGERVGAYELGRAIDASKRAECISAIRELLAHPPTEALFARFTHDFSAERFNQQIVALLRSASRHPVES